MATGVRRGAWAGGAAPHSDPVTWPGSPADAQRGHDALQHGSHPGAGVGSAAAQHGDDELVGLLLEDQQWVARVLPVVPAVGAPFLLPVGRVVGAVEVEHDAAWDTVSLPRVAPTSSSNMPFYYDGLRRKWIGSITGEVVAGPGAEDHESRLRAVT